MKAGYIFVGLALLLIGLSSTGAYAEDSRLALCAKAGTLGLGGEGIFSINEKLSAKVGVNAFNYDYDGTESDVEYDLELELLSFSALLDWFPFSGGLRLSGGMLVNQNSLDIEARSTATYEIGDITYSLAQVGSLTGELDFNDVAPYVGIGWGNPFAKESNWSFAFDLGIMFQGSPDVDLSANGTLATNAAFMAELEREEDNLQDGIDEFEYYPVISLGVAYRF